MNKDTTLSVPARPEEPESFPAINHRPPGSSDEIWCVMVPSRKTGNCIEAGQISFELAPKRHGNRLMQVTHVEGVWAPNSFPTGEDDWDNTRLVLLEVRFLTLLKFGTEIPPIPESGSLGDDDEPEMASGPN